LPCILALNKMDVIDNGNIHIDTQALGNRLGIPVIPIVAENAAGIPELFKAIFACTQPAYA